MKRLVFYTMLFLAWNAGVRAQQGNKSADSPPANANFVGDETVVLRKSCLPIQLRRGLVRRSSAGYEVGSAGKYFSWAAWGDRKQGPAKPDSPTSAEIEANRPYRSSSTIT